MDSEKRKKLKNLCELPLSAISVSQRIYKCTQCDILERKETVDVMLGRAGLGFQIRGQLLSLLTW